MTNFILPWSCRGINYTDEDIEAVVDVMRNADPQTQGEHLIEFEKIFSEYHSGVPSFATSSGAGALEISADLINILPGDEIIIPAHTYVASAIPYARRGAKLVWADIDIGSTVVTVETISEKITSKTKAIIVVHLYGLCAEMEEIMVLAQKHNILVIEDCAQALGSSYKNKKCGTFGHISIFSFHAAKNITTLGEGGMIVTTVPEFAEKIPGLRHNGHRSFSSSRKYYWQPAMVDVDFDIESVWPHNFSIGEAQCALGVSLMKRLDEINERRFYLARKIIDSLSDCTELKFQTIIEESTHVYSNLCAMYSSSNENVDKNALIQLLSEKYKIQPAVQNNPLYRYPIMIRAGFGGSLCPNSDAFFDNMLSLPFFEWYTEEQVEYLIKSTRSAVERLR